MEAFADTPIMTTGGIRFSVGAAQQTLFSETDRFLDALTAAQAANANAIVAPGWTVASEFEEWTDRLILRKSVSFVMMDGAALHGSYLNQNNAAFAAAANVLDEGGGAFTQAELEAKAANFIAQGRHLQLYPQAQAAAAQGPKELLEELANDRGPVTITETIVFGRIVPSIADVSEAAAAVGERLRQPPGTANVPPMEGPSLSRIGSAMVQRAPRISSQPPVAASGLSMATYSSEMLNGFTIGEDWSREVRYERSWVTFKTSVFAVFGLGLRIPWTATIETTPRYITSNHPDRSPFDATVSIDPVNANESFYRSVGLPADRLHNGQELVIRAGAGITLKIELFGETIINRGESNPLIGRNLDLGSHFEPPMNGNTAAAGSPTLYYEDTGLAWQNWLVGIGCDMRAVISLIGDGFDIDVTPHNAWMVSPFGGSVSSSVRSLFFPKQNDPLTIPMAVDDAAPPQTTRSGQRYYSHGLLLSNASYKVDMDVVPEARLRCTLKLSNIIGRLSDLNLSTPWGSLFTASFDLAELGPHANTDDEIQAWADNRRFLPQINSGGRVVRNLTQSTENAGTWTIGLTEDVPLAAGLLKEYIPAGFAVSQILGGGVFHDADRSISWQVSPSPPPAEFGYTLIGPAGQAPTLLGQWQAEGQTEPLPTASVSQLEGGDSSLPLLVRELSKRPTFQELVDGRPGSVVITRDGASQVRLRLQLETSENLESWTVTPETLAAPLEVTQPLPPGKRFFRFRMTD